MTTFFIALSMSVSVFVLLIECDVVALLFVWAVKRIETGKFLHGTELAS